MADGGNGRMETKVVVVLRRALERMCRDGDHWLLPLLPPPLLQLACRTPLATASPVQTKTALQPDRCFANNDQPAASSPVKVRDPCRCGNGPEPEPQPEPGPSRAWAKAST